MVKMVLPLNSGKNGMKWCCDSGNNCVNKNDKANTEVAGTKRNEQGDDAWFIILRKKLDKEMFYR